MPPGTHSHRLTTGVSSLRTVSTIVQLLAGAIKHHALYPEDHSIARQHFNKIHQNFCLFLKNHTTLRLEIGKSTMVYDGDTVYQGKLDENDIAFLLGRDGVEWVEFTRDLELWEIQSFLMIINSNRRSNAENDANIATALWEKDFPHIEYKTIDLMAMDLPQFNLDSFRVAPGPETAADRHTERLGKKAYRENHYWREPDDDDAKMDSSSEEAATGIAISTPDSSLWNLTESEKLQLDAMVRKEEDSVDTESIIEILFILLLIQNDRQEAIEILAFLQDRFLYCMQNQQVKYGLKIIRTLKNIEAAENRQQQWLRPLIFDLFKSVSRPESLRDLEKFFIPPANPVPDIEFDSLWTLLQQLPPDVLKTLAPLSCKIDIQRFGAPFLTVFKHFCRIDSRYLSKVAKEINKQLCLNLFPFINSIRMDQAVHLLSAMTHHPSLLVRSKAFQLLVEWDAVDIKKLFHLIDDPDEAIRQTILSYAGKKRDTGIEQMLRDYLEEDAGGTKDNAHILACYHALGRSGSAQSIPFLTRCLFQRSKLGTLFATGGGAHKEGAARALLLLRIPEAKKIVTDGTTHIQPDVRAACRKAT